MKLIGMVDDCHTAPEEFPELGAGASVRRLPQSSLYGGWAAGRIGRSVRAATG